MKKVITLLLVIACWGLIETTPQPAPTPSAANGCGAWGAAWVTPQLWFREACNRHDVCYQAGGERARCDADFLQDMRGACAGWTRGACLKVADFYYWVVRIANRGK